MEWMVNEKGQLIWEKSFIFYVWKLGNGAGI